MLMTASTLLVDAGDRAIWDGESVPGSEDEGL